MPILGAHQSIAGGYYRAVERACACGCDCVQLFTKNNTQWKARPIVAEEVIRFHQALADSEIAHPLVHDSYLINLASPDKELWKKSVDNFVAELARAQCLGIPYVVTHPGCYVSGTLRGGLRRVIRALNQVHRSTSREGARCLLETTAGQGTSLGWQFEHLAMILDGVREPERLGVCVDTCHLFAAGYRMDDRQQYDATLDALDRTVGLARVRAFHLNDSVKELGSAWIATRTSDAGTWASNPFACC